MNLHAGIILLSVTAGSSMFGITGAFLAVPVAAAVAETLRYLLERVDREAGLVPEGTPPPLDEPARRWPSRPDGHRPGAGRAHKKGRPARSGRPFSVHPSVSGEESRLTSPDRQPAPLHRGAHQ